MILVEASLWLGKVGVSVPDDEADDSEAGTTFETTLDTIERSTIGELVIWGHNEKGRLSNSFREVPRALAHMPFRSRNRSNANIVGCATDGHISMVWSGYLSWTTRASGVLIQETMSLAAGNVSAVLLRIALPQLLVLP